MSQSRTEVKALLERHGLQPARRYGQHFLADPNIIRRIVETARLVPGDRVVEVGVGTGTLTLALASTGAEIVGYEIDRRLEPVHREVFADLDRVEIRYADAGAVELASELEGAPWTMVANLPYNVGTVLLLDVLRKVPQVRRSVVLLQEEVGRRLAAEPGSKVYGLSSVVAQLHADVRVAFRVPPQVFVPPPRVESAVVVLDRRPAPDSAARAIELAARSFRQRRKMIRTSLGLPVSVIEQVGLDPAQRAERLAPEDFVALAEALDA